MIASRNDILREMFSLPIISAEGGFAAPSQYVTASPAREASETDHTPPEVRIRPEPNIGGNWHRADTHPAHPGHTVTVAVDAHSLDESEYILLDGRYLGDGVWGLSPATMKLLGEDSRAIRLRVLYWKER